MPTTSKPSCLSSAAVTEESTPPDMATTTRVSCGRPSTSRLLSIGVCFQLLRPASIGSSHPEGHLASLYYRHSTPRPHDLLRCCRRVWSGRRPFRLGAAARGARGAMLHMDANLSVNPLE